MGLSDTVARIGGDQFGLILTEVASVAQLGSQVERIFAALAEPFIVEGNSVRLSVKGGVTVFPTATDGADADALLTNAEAALKKAKTSAEAYLFYAPQLNAAIANRLTMENRLLRALDEEQFELHYQPQVDSETLRVSGLEALVRWNHPDEGLILPYRFIPLLEESGMILAVGSWILRRAMADRRKLLDLGLAVPRIAVNVSAHADAPEGLPGLHRRGGRRRGDPLGHPRHRDHRELGHGRTSRAASRRCAWCAPWAWACRSTTSAPGTRR